MFILPIGTDRPRIRPSYCTPALIAINVLVLLWVTTLPLVPVPGSAPAEGGPMLGPLLTVKFGLWGSHPEPLNFITYPFIHTGALHLAGNMLFLWLFGTLIEDAIGPLGLVSLYLAG